MRLEDIARCCPLPPGQRRGRRFCKDRRHAHRVAGGRPAESAGLRWASVPPVSDASASFEVTPERLDVRTLRARVLDAALTAKGHWRWVGAGEVEADAGPLDLARIPDLPEGLSIAGRGQARVKAAIQQGRVSGTARLSTDRSRSRASRWAAGSQMSPRMVRPYGGRSSFPEARMAATGQGRLDGDVMIATRVTATDVELEPLLRQYRPDLVGTFSGRFSALGTLDVPARDPRGTRG